VTTGKTQLLDHTKACGTILDVLYLAMEEHRYFEEPKQQTILADQDQADSVFSGISTFGRLPYWPCLASDDEKYDIAFIGTFILAKTHQPELTIHPGAPFDTGTSYRPGARFGPNGIRQGSRRLNL